MADDQTSRQSLTRQASTVEHVKNPGRVAWGKKLALMSRESKAEKKASTARRRRTRSVPNQASDEKIEELLQKDIKIDTETKSNLDLHRIEVLVGIGGLALAAVALYLNYKSNKSAWFSRTESSCSIVACPPQTNATRQSLTVEQYDPRNF